MPRLRPAEEAAREAARLLKGYDFSRCRKALRERGIKARIARRGKERAREVGTAPVGCGADAGMVGPLPKARGALRETGRHPRGVPPSRLLTHLPQLPLVRFCNALLVVWFRLHRSPCACPCWRYPGRPDLRGEHEIPILVRGTGVAPQSFGARSGPYCQEMDRHIVPLREEREHYKLDRAKLPGFEGHGETSRRFTLLPRTSRCSGQRNEEWQLHGSCRKVSVCASS